MSSNSSSSTRQQLKLILELRQQSVNRIIDSAKDNIHKVVDQGITQNSRLSHTIRDIQELSIQVAEEIVDNSLEIQREFIGALTPLWSSKIDYVYNTIWNKWAVPSRTAKTHSKVISAYQDKKTGEFSKSQWLEKKTEVLYGA